MDFQEFVQKHGQAKQVAVGAHLFRQGDPDASLYVIQKGFLKAYYILEDGKEQIKSFIGTGDVIGSISAVYAKELCSFSLLCLEDTRVIRLPFDALFSVSSTDLQMANDLIVILLKFARKKEQREYELLCLSAEDRYRLLVEQTSELLQRTTQENVAKYLGITPVALSRIKKRLAGE